MSACRIAILLFDGAEELDFVGPFEVFTMADAVARHRGDAAGNEVMLVSPDGGDVACAKGMRVGAEHAMAEAPPFDLLCIPGGRGTRQVIEQQPILEWVAERAAGCRWVTSVCTGSFVLAAAGLTKGRAITTHWAAMEEFAELGLEAGELRRDVRYVRDGPLVTAAGISAGIDMALWLTGEIHGVALARATQRAMEYHPTPPYAADV